MSSDCLLKKAWPAHECMMLIRTYACDEKKALVNWREWQEKRDIDTASWSEVRLMASILNRVKEIEIDSALEPRLEGIRRFFWSKNQMNLAQSLRVVDLLLAEGCVPMVIKGGARLAMDPSIASVRFMRDLDLLLRPEDLTRGIDVLIRNGYRPRNGKLPGRIRGSDFDNVYINRKRRDANCGVDIHQGPLRYGSFGNFEKGLFKRARKAEIKKREIIIPSPADQFIITIAHGVVADEERPADWVIDMICLMNEPDFNWEVVLKETENRQLYLPMASAIHLLHDELKISVPDYVYKRIMDGSQDWLLRCEFEADTTIGRDRKLSGKILSAIAEYRRSRKNWRGKSGPSLSYLGRPSWTTQRKGIEVDAFPAKIQINDQMRQKKKMILKVNLVQPLSKRRQYDMVADGQWLGRLRIHPYLGKGKQWVFHVPVPDDNIKEITIYQLDENCHPLGIEHAIEQTTTAN